MKNTYILNKITALSETVPKLPSVILMLLLAVAVFVERCTLWGHSESRILAVAVALVLGFSLLAFFLKNKQLAHFVFLRKSMLLTMVMAACLGGSALAQSPGGVSANLRVWLKANDGFTPSSWADRSGSGNNFTQTNSNRQPFSSGVQAKYNYYPAADFGTLTTDARFMVVPNGRPYTADGKPSSVYIMLDRKTTSTANGFYDYIGFGNTGTGAGLLQANNPGVTNGDANTIQVYPYAVVPLADRPSLTATLGKLNMVDYSYSIGGDITHGYNGMQKVQNVTYTAANSQTAQGAILGSQVEETNSSMSEVICFERELTGAERDKVRSYLALKYGITLSSAIYGQYTNSAGVAVYLYSANTGYTNNIFGLIKDDGSALNQKISRSTNDASMLVIGTNNMSLPLSNLDATRTSLNNGQSFIVGDNNAASSAYTTFAASCNNPTSVILTRKWKVENVGNVGNLYFTVNLAPSGINGDPTMVIYNTAGVAREIEGSLNADGTATFAATVADGETFTFSGIRGAGVCTTGTGAGSILWKTSGWVRGANGPSNLAIAGTDITAAIEFKDPNAVEYAPAVRPKRRGKTIMLDRKDQLAVASSSYTASFTLTKAGKANFVIHAVDAWAKCLDVVEVKGYCGATLITPTLSYTLPAARSSYTINGNIATGIVNKWSGYDYKRGKVNVRFDRQVDKIEIVWKTDKPTTRKKFQRIGISDMNFECDPPDPCLQNSEQITFEKKLIGASNIPTCEEVRFMYRIKNQNCAAKTVNISDVLPSGMTWVDDSFEDGALTTGTANTYANTNSFNLTGLTIPASGTAIFYVSAKFTNSTPAAYSNRASMAVSGGGTVQSSCGNTTWNSVAPALTPVAVPTVTLAASKTCYLANETITYTVTVNNTSGAAASGMEFSAALGEDFTFVAGSVSNLFGGTANTYGGEELLEIEGMTFPTGTSTFTYQVATGASNTDFPLSVNLSADPDADCSVENSRVSNDVNMTLCVPSSPGCTATTPAVWLKANTGTSTTTVGSQVTTWANQGSTVGNVVGGTGAGASSIAGQTTSPIYEQTSLFNFNPSVAFNTTAGMGMLNALPANPTKWAVYYVNKINDITYWKSHVGFSNSAALGTASGAGIAGENVTMNYLGAPYFWQGYSAGATNPLAYTTDKAFITGWQWASAGAGVSNTINGRTGNTGLALSANNLRNFILSADPDGGAEDGGNYDGESYSEVLVFDNTLTAAEHQRVQSYLAIKYGISLDQTVATNYLAGDGSIVWNVATNTGYNNNITGISKDACQGLDQKQSKSQNDGFQPIISTTGFAATNTTNTTSLTDKTAELSGSDAGATSLATPFVFGGMNNRITRVWKIQETGTVGNVKVAIAKSDLGGTNPNLLRSVGNATFDGSDTMLPMSVETIGGVEYYTATIDFNNNDFYTFGAYVTSPGCVAGNLKAWYKADAGISVANGATVSSWTNAVDNTYNAGQVTVGARPTYYNSTAANLVNFNPSLSFDGGDELINSTRLFSNTAPFTQIAMAIDRRTNTAELRAPFGMGYGNGNFIGMDFQTDVFSPNGFNPYSGVDAEWVNYTPTYRTSSLGLGATNTGGNIVGLTSNNIAGGSDNVISYVNGAKDLTTITANQNAYFGNGFYIGSSGDAQWLGLVPEIIVYDKQLTDAEMQRVYSYLAIKYGTTLAQDYILGDGTTKVWDKTANTAYHNNVFGIGRDDCQGLYQKQSKSTIGNYVTISNGTSVAATNAANTSTITDKNFDVIGDNGLDQNYGVAYAPTTFTPTGSFNRMNAIWKVQETGTVGNVTIAVPVGADRLLVSSTAAFGAGTQEIALTVVNGMATAQVDLANGQFFSFGRDIKAPGCVAANLKVWFKADAGAGSTDGAAVTSWTEQAFGTYNVTQPNATYQPKFYNTTSNKLINFNPVVDFDGADDHIRNLTPMMPSNSKYTLMAVGVDEAADLGYRALFSAEKYVDYLILYKEGLTTTNGWRPYGVGGLSDYGYMGKGTKYSPQGGSNGFYNGTNYTPNTKTAVVQPTIVGFNSDNNVTSTAAARAGFNTWVDGYKDSPGWAPTDEAYAPYQANLLQSLGLGTDMGENGVAFEFWKGRIPEFIAYDRNLTDPEMAKVNTYLAIKYGVTLGQGNGHVGINGNNYNYVRGDGTVIWDATANSGYQADIFGIGQDACQDLYQKQSKSVNASSFVTIGAAAIAATNAANTGTIADKGFEMIGDNGLATSYATTYAPSTFTPASGFYLMSRVWKVQETGTVGMVTISVPAGADRLIVSNTAAFTPGGTTQEIVLTADGNGNVTAQVDLTNGQFFTFGRAITAPGCVAANLQLWLKADAGTTLASGKVSSWASQGVGLSVTQAAAAKQPALVANGMNFNPALDYTGAQVLINATQAKLVFPGTTNAATMYAVSTNRNATNWWKELINFDGNDDYPSPSLGWVAQQPDAYIYGVTSPDQRHTVSIPLNTPTMMFARTPNASPGSVRLSYNGLANQQTFANTVNTFVAGQNEFAIGAETDALREPTDGLLPEVIVYNRELTDAEIKRVNTYLGIKYGIQLTEDYIAGNGTSIIWDKTANAAYHNNVTVIGRDDCQGLSQKQSKSVNAAATMTIGIDNIIAATNAANTGAFDTNTSFLAFGDNNLTGTAAIAPGSACTPGSADKATNKIWKFVETGTVETTKVSTDLSAFGFNSLSTVFMQVATDAAFTNVVTNIPTAYSAAASAFEANYDFTGTQYVRYVGQTTLPANVCTGPSKTLNWLAFAPFDWWQWGTRSKTLALGDGLNAKVTIDDPNNKILHGNTPVSGVKQGYYPVNYGNYLYIPRYDGNPTSTITTRIELLDGTNAKMPANAVSFKLKDIDGWYWGKDDVKVYGKLGGVVVNPKITLNKYTALTATPPTQVQGSIWPWDWTVLGDAYVNFDNPVDEIFIEYKKSNLFNFNVFNDLAIGHIEVSCKAPEPEVAIPDNVYLFKEASPKTVRAGEPFTYKFTFKNYNCAAKTISFTDALPTGLTFKDSTLTTSNTIGTTNVYGNSANLNLTNLSVPVGTSYLYVDAVASTTGTLNNQASIVVNGNTYQSDEPSLAGAANATPVTVIAAPQVANLTLTKSVDKASAPQNTNVEYTLTVKNNGAAAVTTQIQDYLQGDATYVASSLTYTPALTGQTENSYATTGTLDIRDVTIGAGATLIIKVRAKLGINPVVNDTLVNNFSVNTGLGADAATYMYKKFTSNNTKTLIQNLPSLAGTVFNDGGAGGGTPGNCIKDGTEGATGLPTGLYAKLIASGATTASQAVAVSSGTYSFTAVSDGGYTVILDDNTTLSDITSTLPSGWSGTSSRIGTSTGGVFTPTLTFCISNVPAQVTVVAVANTVFNDNGAGAGTANNCTKDGTETAAGIPSGLFAKLIKAGTVLKVEPIDANGGFTMSAVNVGTGYSIIVDNNNSYTDAISNIPANWTVSTWTGDVTATTPFTAPALKFCMYYSLPTFTVTATPNTVFNDAGTGGGTAGNCTLDGTEDATGLPSPLYAKLIQAGAVVQAATVTSGGFAFSNIPDGSYTIILDDNNTLTDVTTTLPTGWTGTTSWAGTLTSGAPSPAMKFCIYNPPPGPCAGTSSVVGAMPVGAYVTAGSVVTAMNSVDFGASATGVLGTDRNPGNVGAYLFKAAAMPLNASNANFIDGYVRKTGGANVTFPVGDNGSYRPAIVNWAAACPSLMEVAYFGADPNIGVTSKLAAGGGGNFPTAPSGGPFPTNQRVSNLFSVSNKEYWDINGTDQAEITLTWNAASDITGLSTANVNNLSIAGWNTSTGKWERIPSTVVAGSNLTTGSIKTDATLIPNTYNVYTFAGTIIPNIATVKTAPATISQFVPFDYSFSVKNNGTVPTTANTIVRDTLKNGLKYISYSGAWTCAFAGTTASGDDVVECTIYSTLAPGTSVLAGLRVNPTLGGAISNTSRTSGGGMTGGPYKSSTNESSAGTPQNPTAGAATTSNVTAIPNLVTTKVAPVTPISQGVKFDYTITVNNTGSVATSGAITVRDTLKNGLKYVGYTGSNWTCTKTGVDLSGNDVVVCTSNTTLAANTGTSGVILTVLPTQATSISNMTWTSGGGMPGGPYKSGPTPGTAGSVQNPTDGGPTGSGNNPGVVVVVPKPILVTTKVGPGTPIAQYQNFDYIFTVTNNGAANTTGAITILDTLRNGLNYQSTGSAGWACSVIGTDANGNQILECMTSNVINASGDNEVVNVTVKPTKAVAISNLAWVSGGGIPGGPYPTSPVSTTAGNALNPTPNPPVSTPNTASPIPSIATVKTALSSTIEQFMPFDYKFDLENKGSAATSGLLVIRDTLKNGLKYMSMTVGSPDWTCSLVGQDLSGNDVVQCQTSTPIAAYNPATLTGGTSSYTIRVKPTLAGNITNLAWVNGGGMPNGPYKTGSTPGNTGSPINPGGGGSTAPTTVTPVPILKTAKVAPSVAVQQFIPFAYTFDVFNDGSAATAGAITVKDTLKNNLIFVSGGNASWTCAVTGNDASGNQIVECTSSTAIAPTTTSSFPLNVKSTTGGATSNIAYVNGGGMPSGPYKTAPTTMGSGNPTNPTGGGSTTNNVTAVPNLTTVKEAPSTAITQFVPFDYTIKVTNSGGANSGGTVTVRDTLKTGLKYNGFVGTGWTCAKTGVDLYGNDVVVCTYSNAIAVNQTASYTLNVNPTIATNVTNMTWTNGGGMPGGPYKSGSTPATAGSINNPTGGGPTGTSPATPVSPVPDLKTAKIVGSGPFNQNQPFIYNFQITNAGGISTSGLVTITDTLKNGLKYVSGGNTDWTCVKTGVDANGNDIVKCSSLQTIATGNTTSFPLQVNPTQASNTSNLAWTNGGGMPGGPYKSGTTAATAAGPSNPGGGTPTAPTPIGPGLPDVILLISQPSPVLTEGLQSVVQFTVTNQGNGAATGPINVNITLPTELSAPPTFTSGAWTCTTAGVNISCSSQNTATIAINTSVQFDIPVVPAAGSLGKILSISGAIPAVTNENIVNNNSATMTANNPVQTGTRPDLLTAIGTIPTLTEGTTSLIPVTVSNIGNGAATGALTFSTNLPNGLVAAPTFTQNGWTCNTSGQTVSCSNPNTAGVAPNAAVPFDIPVTPSIGSAGTTPTVTGLVNQVLNELVTNNNTGSSTAAQSIQPANRPDLQTIIGQPSTPLTEGSASNIPVILNNIGTAPAIGALTFSTNLPNGLTAPLTFTENGWTCNTSGQTVSCSNPNAAGLPATSGTTNFNIPITPSVGTAGQTPTLTGSASPVVSETATANNTTSMTPTGVIAPLARPDLTTTIGQPAPDLTEGVTSNIPVTLANIGNAPATGTLTFSMALPNGMTTPPTFTNNGWTCSTSGQAVNCSNPNAAGLPATTGTTTFNIPLTPAAGTAGQTPTLTGNSSPAPNETSTANNSGSMTPTNPVVAMARPDILTTIGQPAPGFTEGTTSNVPVTLANIGNGPATGSLSFSTTLPNGLTAPLTFNNNGWTCSTTGQTVNCSNPNAAGLPAATGTSTLDIPVTPLVGSAGQTPSISGNTPPVTNETVTANNSGSMTPTTSIAAMARPDVQTVIGAIPTLTEGTTSNIPVTLNNIGNAAATGALSFSTTLPNGLSTAPTFTNNGWTCSTSGQTVNCSTPNAAGLPATTGTTTFNLPVTPSASSVGQTPTVSGTTAAAINEIVTTNNTGSSTATSAIIAAARPDLTTTIGTPSPVLTEGVTSNIPITLTNIGNAPATGPLTFTSMLPNGVTAGTFTNNGWTCSTSAQTVSCTNPNTAGLPATGITTFNLPVTPSAGTAGQTPTISGTSGTVPNETNTANNTGTLGTPMTIAAALKPDLAISFGTPTPVLAETVLSTIPVTIANIGTLSATGQMVVTINIPNNTTSPTSYATNGWTCSASGSILTCVTANVGGLASTASTTFDIRLTPNSGTAGQLVLLTGNVSVTSGETNTVNNAATTVVLTPIAVPPATLLNIKVMLQGAMLGTTDGLMTDNLRLQNLLPLVSPYNSSLATKFTNVAETANTTTLAVLNANIGTPDAIVDWVFIELRNAASPATVVKTYSALLQRDGDVIGTNGQPLRIDLLGSYLISIKHRNHLGAMMANPIALNGIAQTIDFTTASSASLYNAAGYDGVEMATVNGKRALWAGNCNADNKVKYDGSSNDKSNVLTGSITNVVNTSTIFNFNGAYGYVLGDINMDGKVKYDGSSNEKSTLLGIVLSYPLNAATPLFNYNFFLEQLP